ncbi:AbrB family transcriptional regulator [Microbacterium sp. NPDC076911]|uniref:AbrB family transcriptional regulator n=1 Tax=Microbacterium sp. NPDC076911 TaxID=3154958 RepID=UPI00342776D6
MRDAFTRGAILLGLVVASLAIGLPLQTAGLSSATLFAGLAIGAAVALATSQVRVFPKPVVRAAHGGVGVVVASSVSYTALDSFTTTWSFVLVAVTVTLLLGFLGAWLFFVVTKSSDVTSLLAMLPGGAAGVSALSSELGADDRVVSVSQYTRLLIVVLSLPLIATPLGAVASAGDGPAFDLLAPIDPTGLALVVVTILVGGWGASKLKIPASWLLGPLIVGVMFAAFLPGLWSPPAQLTPIVFAIVGLVIGLTFDRASFKAVAAVVPWVAAIAVVLIAATFLASTLAADIWGIDRLDAYLATAPGGVYAVAAYAATSADDSALVMATQTARLLAVLALTPLLAWGLRQRRRPR